MSDGSEDAISLDTLIRVSRLARVLQTVGHPFGVAAATCMQVLADPNVTRRLRRVENRIEGRLAGPLVTTALFYDLNGHRSPGGVRGARIVTKRVVSLWPITAALVSGEGISSGEAISCATDIGAFGPDQIQAQVRAQVGRACPGGRVTPAPVAGPMAGWDAMAGWLGGLTLECAGAIAVHAWVCRAGGVVPEQVEGDDDQKVSALLMQRWAHDGKYLAELVRGPLPVAMGAPRVLSPATIDVRRSHEQVLRAARRIGELLTGTAVLLDVPAAGARVRL